MICCLLCYCLDSLGLFPVVILLNNSNFCGKVFSWLTGKNQKPTQTAISIVNGVMTVERNGNSDGGGIVIEPEADLNFWHLPNSPSWLRWGIYFNCCPVVSENNFDYFFRRFQEILSWPAVSLLCTSIGIIFIFYAYTWKELHFNKTKLFYFEGELEFLRKSVWLLFFFPLLINAESFTLKSMAAY